RLANNVITALAIATIVLVVVGLFLARPLAHAFAGDYAATPGKLELTIYLTRIMLPFLTLAAIAAAMMGMLNSLHHHFMPVVLPAAARHAALKDSVAIRRTVSRGLGLMLALNVPATIGLIALAVPIVRVLFEHGRFLPSDTEAVAAAVRVYAIGLVGYSAARI